MTTKRWVWREGRGVIPVEEAYPEPKTHGHHYVQQDSMPPTEHPATGEIFESKSAFRAVTKALGYEEVGSTWSTQEKREKWNKERKSSVRDLHKQEAYTRELRENIRKVIGDMKNGKR
jgi:hypothetical protein